MLESESFEALIQRLRTGDDDAAAEVFQRFAGRVIGLARSRLDSRIRRKVDPEDVAQSVFRSFFVRQAQGRFELRNWDGLWSLLVRITLRKCGRQLAALCADRRDVRKEAIHAGCADESCRAWEAIAREPTPQEAAQLTETVEHLLRGLDDVQRQIVVLRLQGYTILEVSREVGRTERTVHRVLATVREGLQRLEREPLA